MKRFKMISFALLLTIALLTVACAEGIQFEQTDLPATEEIYAPLVSETADELGEVELPTPEADENPSKETASFDEAFAVEATPLDTDDTDAGKKAVMSASSDSEDSLRSLLKKRTGSAKIAGFYYADYDGDGRHEAFAYAKTADYEDCSEGDIWFVNSDGTTKLDSGKCYWDEFAVVGKAPHKLFVANEYRTSTSKTDMWIVQKGVPRSVNANISDIYAGDSDTPLFCTVDAYDGWTDGSGHTWKKYYFYFEGTQLREYGGIYISKAQFLKFKNAKEILNKYTPKYSSLVSIIYRSNHVINLNFSESGEFGANHYVSVKYRNGAVTFWESGEGLYRTASHSSIATYPKEFKAPVNGPVLNATSIKLGVKETYQLAAADKGYTYKSSNNKIAKVSSKGLITAREAGTATITVKNSKGQKATCKVTVKKAPKKITLNKSKMTLEKGDVYQLKATLPSGSYARKLTWTSSNKKVAKVNSKGKVTAVGKGTATITVKTVGGVKATCKVTGSIPTGTKTIELSGYYNKNFETAKNVIKNYTYYVDKSLDENFGKAYYNDTIFMSSYSSKVIDEIWLMKNSQYALQGVKIGMTREQVKKNIVSCTIIDDWDTGHGSDYTKDKLLDYDYENYQSYSVKRKNIDVEYNLYLYVRYDGHGKVKCVHLGRES